MVPALVPGLTVAPALRVSEPVRVKLPWRVRPAGSVTLSAYVPGSGITRVLPVWFSASEMRPVVPTCGLLSSTCSTAKLPWKPTPVLVSVPVSSQGEKSTLAPACAATPAAELVPHQLPEALKTVVLVFFTPAVLPVNELLNTVVPVKLEPNPVQT